MKFSLITFFFLVTFSFARAQQLTTSQKDALNDTLKVFSTAQARPSFPGGEVKFNQYVADSLKYPVEARKNNIQGKVFLMFIVERDGTPSDIKVVRGIGGGCDEEAVRLLKNGPKWTAGRQNGRRVRAQYSMVINLKLPSERSAPKTLVIDTTIKSFGPPDTNKVFTAVEQEPSPVGGIAAFYDYLSQNMHYPEKSREKGIQGTVHLSFVVEKDGSRSNIRVTKGVSKEIDAEAIRVIKEGPKWRPGIQNGKPVRVMYSVPIRFSLTSTNE